MTKGDFENTILKYPGVEEYPGQGAAPSSWRRHLLLGMGLGLVVFVCWFARREQQGSLARQQAHKIVSEFDGRIGSLPFWPFGSEYHILFENRHFTKDDLSKLEGLNGLAEWGTNYVTIHFRDTNLIRDDILKLRELCPRCRIYRSIHGELLINE